MAAAPEQVQPEHPQKVEAKKDHHQPRHQVDGGLVFPQETAHRPGQGPQGHKHQGKAAHKAQGPGEGFPDGALPAPCKVGDVDGEHGQKAGGNKGDDPFQKGDYILHEPSHPVPNTPDSSHPTRPI